jgi:predicted transposase YdaD
LTPSNSPLVHQTTFEIPRMRHEFDVIRLWEQPTQSFLEATGLLPLAVLTQTPDQEQTLRDVAARVEAIPDIRRQSNVAASAGILAGLLLERDLIQQILRREIMQQSVLYQEWRAEFLREGEQIGEQRGAQREAAALILRQLAHRFGTLPEPLVTRIEQLPLEQLESLSVAWLDWQGVEDLEGWLRNQ